MYKSLSLVASLVLLSSAVHAISADISLGVANKSMTAATENQDSQSLRAAYSVPSLSLGLKSVLTGPLSFHAHLKGDIAALESLHVYGVNVAPGYALEASAGLSYETGNSVFYAGPALGVVNVDFSASDAREQKLFSGFGGIASLSHQVTDLVGVRVQAQRIINRSVSTWEQDTLNDKIGALNTNVSELSVGLYTDLTY